MITAIFFDFNAFLYFAYLFPLAEILRENQLGAHMESGGSVVSWAALKLF